MGHGVFLRACALIALVASVTRTSSAAEESTEIVRRPSHRFAFTPSYAHAFVGRSVSHDALGLAAELHLGRRLGFALVRSERLPELALALEARHLMYVAIPRRGTANRS